MAAIKEKQFITDSEGKKIAVILPIEKYDKLMEELEMMEDVAAYDKAKAEDDGERVSIEQVLKENDIKFEELDH